MPKVGNYDYPAIGLDECIKFLDKAKSHKMFTFKRDSFAEITGLSVKSGYFNLVVGSLALYGLIETGDGSVRISELGKTIIYDDVERDAAKSKAVKNVVLFSDIFKEYGRDPTDMQLRIFLKDRINLDISEVDVGSAKISKIFKKVAKYITTTNEKQGISDTGGEYEDLMKDPEVSNKEGQWILLHPYGGALKIVNERSYKAALNLLEELKEKYEPQKGSLKNNSNHIKGDKDSSQPT